MGFWGRSKPARAPKYFVYVSDTKVDMLLGQIPKRLLKRLAVDVEVDLKVLSVSVSEKDQEEESRYARARVVAQYLHDHVPVGTVDAPEGYFAGEMTMQWGLIKDPHHVSTNLVWFLGQTETTKVGLGGSRHHLIGALPVEPEQISFPTEIVSTTSGILATLAWSLGDDLGEPVELWDGGRLSRIAIRETASGHSEDEVGADGVRERVRPPDRGDLAQSKAPFLAVLRSDAFLQGNPPQLVEIVARRLLHGPNPWLDDDFLERSLSAQFGPGWRQDVTPGYVEHLRQPATVLLGSPIYVALAD